MIYLYYTIHMLSITIHLLKLANMHIIQQLGIVTAIWSGTLPPQSRYLQVQGRIGYAQLSEAAFLLHPDYVSPNSLTYTVKHNTQLLSRQ